MNITQYTSSRTRLALVGLAVLALSAGCANASAGTASKTTTTTLTTTSSATLSGQVVVEGGPPVTTGNADGSRPIPHARILITGTTTDQAQLIRHLASDAHGRFRAVLPDGSYTVTAIAYGPAGRALSTQPHQTITITNQKPVKVRLIAYDV